MIVGYLDNNKRNISADEQKEIIACYARTRSMDVDVFLSDVDVKNIIDNISVKGTWLIIANVACLGNKLTEIVENIEKLISNNFTLVSAKENLVFDNSQKTQALLEGVKLSIDMRNSMVSTITTNAISSRKSNGQVVGRQFGSKNKKRLLDDKYEEIKDCILRGLSRAEIARFVKVSIATLYNFLKDHPELKCIGEGGK